MAISPQFPQRSAVERRELIVSLGLASLATPLLSCAGQADSEARTHAATLEGQPGGLSDLREPSEPEPGIGLCLSGGGYRAMLFHVGALWRLYECGLLKRTQRVSSVSGGSITAGLLGLKWSRLPDDPTTGRSAFVQEVVEPIRGLAGHTLDRSAIVIGGILPGTSIADRVVAAYQEHLFGAATLQDLPDEPRFVINATNVQTGALWRFSKVYMADYQVGVVEHPRVLLAVAVAASSAFPPVLSPLRLELEPSAFKPGSGDGLQKRPYTEEAVLTDGGVYDNLGLETVWKNYDTVLVSDAGGKLQPEGETATDWGRHVVRVLDVIDNQVRSLRKRQLMDSFDSGTRKGTYWGIRTDIAEYELPDALPAPYERTLQLAEVPTRLERMPPRLQEQLINWGYAVCDAAVRRRVDGSIQPGAFPYPAASV
jgi:NTE family protein